MKLINVDGIKLNYQEKGDGPVVVLVHGIPTDYRVWDKQVEALSPQYRTVAYSRRCAFPNQNKDVANSTVENNAKDLEGLIAQLGGAPVHLIGHSYGAATAAFCALTFSKLAPFTRSRTNAGRPSSRRNPTSTLDSSIPLA